MFYEIFKNTYFVEYLQQLLLLIAVSAVEKILTFNISIFAVFAQMPE